MAGTLAVDFPLQVLTMRCALQSLPSALLNSTLIICFEDEVDSVLHVKKQIKRYVSGQCCDDSNGTYELVLSSLKVRLVENFAPTCPVASEPMPTLNSVPIENSEDSAERKEDWVST